MFDMAKRSSQTDVVTGPVTLENQPSFMFNHQGVDIGYPIRVDFLDEFRKGLWIKPGLRWRGNQPAISEHGGCDADLLGCRRQGQAGSQKAGKNAAPDKHRTPPRSSGNLFAQSDAYNGCWRPLVYCCHKHTEGISVCTVPVHTDSSQRPDRAQSGPFLLSVDQGQKHLGSGTLSKKW